MMTLLWKQRVWTYGYIKELFLESLKRDANFRREAFIDPHKNEKIMRDIPDTRNSEKGIEVSKIQYICSALI